MPLLGDEIDRGGQQSPPAPAGWPPQRQPRTAGRTEATPAARRPATTRATSASRRAGFFSTCSNPECASGWLHLWRKRSAPVFEGGWVCSAACTSARIEAAVRREMEGKRLDSASHRHRVPLGLVMLEQGWITSEQLRQTVDAQRSAGQGKLGQWLVRQHKISEHLVARALSLQWSCAVLPLEQHDPDAMAAMLPRLFIDAFGALPIRVAAGAILYVGFEERPDPVVALALERMSGLHVEPGLVPESVFQSAHQRMLSAAYPSIELQEAASESSLIRVLARAVERAKPVEAKLVRIHDCLWLRMWTRPRSGPVPESSGVEDVVCSLAPD
jgi:Type II secretion system (T2SS), protein E, N-terminal domain